MQATTLLSPYCFLSEQSVNGFSRKYPDLYPFLRLGTAGVLSQRQEPLLIQEIFQVNNVTVSVLRGCYRYILMILQSEKQGIKLKSLFASVLIKTIFSKTNGIFPEHCGNWACMCQQSRNLYLGQTKRRHYQLIQGTEKLCTRKYFVYFFLFFVRGEWGGKDYALENYSVLKNNFEENENRSSSLLIVLYFSSLEYSALLQGCAVHIITWLSITFGAPTGTGAISWELKTWEGQFLSHTQLFFKTVMGLISFNELL